MEIFEPVKGYEDKYLVDASGNVWSVRKGKYLKPNTDRYGYEYFIFSVDGIRKTVKAHRLVAETFIPNPENKPTVDHINGNKKDNRVTNLRWATNKEQTLNPNTYEKIINLQTREKMKKIGAIRNYGRKPVKVFRCGDIVGCFESLWDAAKKLEVNYSKASECANGKRNHSGGYTFRYANGDL